MNQSDWLIIVKLASMFIMFIMILIVGSVPLRMKAFKENQHLLALTGAFSGGLFISVGLIHLLPEAILYFEMDQQQKGLNSMQQFPYACLITVLSFTLILYIEKVLFAGSHDHHTKHGHSNLQEDQDKSTDDKVGVELQIQSQNQQGIPSSTLKQQDPQLVPIDDQQQSKQSQLTPYILQIAIGIHALFEGLAIGIERKLANCIGISLAVICHKWAEGLTLGLAFRAAGVDLRTATIMIVIQATMNPLGVLLGWVLSDEGYLISGIFESISAGTFIYIATLEVINEEFSRLRYQNQKMIVFVLAIGFISSIWFLEQATQQ